MLGIDQRAKLLLEGKSTLHVDIIDAWPNKEKCLEVARNNEGVRASMRVVGPSTVITHDFNTNRLTIRTDEDDNILDVYWA